MVPTYLLPKGSGPNGRIVCHYEISGGPAWRDFTLSCIDPYPILGQRRIVTFSACMCRGSVANNPVGFNAGITMLRNPTSCDVWDFEARVEFLDRFNDLVWKEVRGQYSTQTRTGFFYRVEDLEKCESVTA